MDREEENSDISKHIKAGVIKSIDSPLGFFVLALFIVEGFSTFTTFTIFSKLSGENLFWYVLIAGPGLFIFLIIVVSIFVWYKPDSLTYDRYAHQYRSIFGSNKRPTKYVDHLEATNVSKAEMTEISKEDKNE